MIRTVLAAALAVVLQNAPASAAPANSGRFIATVTGAGSDVILIPGLASSGSVWDATVTHLRPSHRVHVIQLAGFAGSPAGANAEGPIIQPVIAALHAYIIANHLKSPAIIGHSLGGLIGMELALDRPGDVGRLMIVDALPFFGVVQGKASVAEVEPAAAAMRDRIVAGSQESYATYEPRIMATLVKSTGPAEQAAVAAAIASDHKVVARAMYEDMTTDLRPRIAELKLPVTMLYPWDASTGIPQAAFDSLYTAAYAALPNGHVKRIDGSFHFIMVDQPAAFAAAVTEFMAH